ncbi:MAG TPA: ABC transporter permease, partial [Thermoanaerobaculia bacterium]|nr:ABC transporter permease [Thermoanaerobaculia bacterium]
ALLAQLHPLATLVSAFFFGGLATGAGELQRSANISATVATLIQAVVILMLILFGSSRLRGGRT